MTEQFCGHMAFIFQVTHVLIVSASVRNGSKITQTAEIKCLLVEAQVTGISLKYLLERGTSFWCYYDVILVIMTSYLSL